MPLCVLLIHKPFWYLRLFKLVMTNGPAYLLMDMKCIQARCRSTSTHARFVISAAGLSCSMAFPCNEWFVCPVWCHRLVEERGPLWQLNKTLWELSFSWLLSAVWLLMSLLLHGDHLIQSSEVRHRAGALEQIRMTDIILSMSVHSDVRVIYPEVS